MTTPSKISLELVTAKRQIQNLMLSNGLPKNLLTSKPFTLADQLTDIRFNSPDMYKKVIKTGVQSEHFKKIMGNPLFSGYVCCVSGHPNDQQAKLLAAMIMAKATMSHIAIESSKDSSRKRLIKNRGYPFWHNINGSFQDTVRDGKLESIPSLIVISGVTVESSSVKLEKLRDVLEMCNQIPRVVVATGFDGLTLFNTRLHYSLNFTINLSNRRVMREIEI